MNIGRLAPFYRWIEYAAFGRALEKRRFALLPHLSGARRVLVLGEGDGRALARMLAIAPAAQFDVVESSAGMIELARARVADSGWVRFFCCDALTADWPEKNYDAIVTFFFLDCFDEPDVRRLVERLQQSLSPEGIWLVSDFAIPPTGWRHWHAAAWVRIMYWFFRALTGLRTKALAPFEGILRGAGLERIAHQSARAGLIFSSAWIQRGPDL